MRAVEDGHWWYVALRRLVSDRLGDARDILDAGCGTGGMMAQLDGRHVVGVDASPIAISICRERGLRRLVRASVDRLPFPDSSFDAVLSLDVLYHRDVADDVEGVREMARVLRPGGRLFLHLPAHPSLAGSHDSAVHGVRRYGLGAARRLFDRAGLVVRESSYRNAVALPAAFLRRRIASRRLTPDAESDLRPMPRLLNATLTTIALAENRWLLKGQRVPFGLSVWCVGEKQ